MPRRSDIASILIIGSGPIVIGQACEFDYSGTQACKALREEGYRVILVNSNPATIMTDPDIADRVYVEPLTVHTLKAIIAKERPDALLPTMGGQTALNLALALGDAGVLAAFGVELIGANCAAIRKAEDRVLFKETMIRLGLNVPASGYAHTPDEAVQVLSQVGLPAIIRPAFTLGGHGGSIAATRDDFERCIAWGLAQSPVHQVLIESSIVGWKEFELEVMRDCADNVVIICSIENIDPMGVHTGDSITVAPAQTLTDKEYQRMRDAAKLIIRAIGVETGGSNIQFAVNPVDGELVVIEMNPRVSRSSALASKATGYPIAKIAAKVAVGYTLDELPNDITRETRAAFEPTIDYVVTKIPRFAFEKFPHTEPILTTQMKSVGEVMAIGRTFPESLHKAMRSLETGSSGFESLRSASQEEVEMGLRRPTPKRLWWVGEALRRGMRSAAIHRYSGIDPWFLEQIQKIIECEKAFTCHREPRRGVPAQSHDRGDLANLAGDERLRSEERNDMLNAKALGFSDARLAEISDRTEGEIAALRKQHHVTPTYRMVDTCAAEFEAYTPYLYSTYDGDSAASNEAPPSTRRKVIILGSGPNRIGQGIEFDYCCVQAVFALRESGYETIMINCNPETVSTDYDTADRLYFEPLTFEDVMQIIEREKPDGVVVQFGGQTPLKLAKHLAAAGVPILGTPPEAIDRAEDRGLFRELIATLGLTQPPSGIARTFAEARVVAQMIGYPVMVRPSYVLGGRAMEVLYNEAGLKRYLREAVAASPEHPVLIDRFLASATEVDVDALADGEEVVVVGIMEHVEEAGIHSGDSSCCLPAFSLKTEIIASIEAQTITLGKALGVIGLLNVQFAIQNGVVYVLEVNPRASRTVPFVAKATGIPVARLAAKLLIGQRLKTLLTSDQLPLLRTDALTHTIYAVKAPVFPFTKFPGVDTILGPEMKSTGEVMGIADSFGAAFAKAQEAAGNPLPASGEVFISVRDEDKPAIVPLAEALVTMGFTIGATAGTCAYLSERGLPVRLVRKVAEGSPHVCDALKEGRFALVVNTTIPNATAVADSYSIRRTTIECNIPYFTTISAARAAIQGMRIQHTATIDVRSLQEWHAGQSDEKMSVMESEKPSRRGDFRCEPAVKT